VAGRSALLPRFQPGIGIPGLGRECRRDLRLAAGRTLLL